MVEEISVIFELLVSSFGSLISLFTYVAVGYGLYCIAQACGIRNPFLAWIPYGQVYMLGAVADHQTARNESRTTGYRKILLGLEIAVSAVALVLGVSLGVVLVSAIFSTVGGTGAELTLESVDWEAVLGDMLGGLVVSAVVLVALAVVAIVYAVYYYIALYRIYKLVDPKNATLYTVLSVFFNIAIPIIFLVIAKKKPVYACGTEPFYVNSTTDSANGDSHTTYSV